MTWNCQFEQRVFFETFFWKKKIFLLNFLLIAIYQGKHLVYLKLLLCEWLFSNAHNVDSFFIKQILQSWKYS